MTHASYTPAQRAEAGTTDSLVRISVSLEDIAADINRALQAV